MGALDSYRNPGNSSNEPSLSEAIANNAATSCTPAFPFLSVLASGGHTLLIYSASLVDHRVMATTNDIAIGECLDKIARVVLPADLLRTTKSTMYGALLEAFALPARQPIIGEERAEPKGSELPAHTASTFIESYGYKYDWSFLNNEEVVQKSTTSWGWAIHQPLTKSSGGSKINKLEMSFSGLMTAVERIVRHGTDPVTKKLNKTERSATDVSLEERKDIARETMRASFEHIASRVVLGLQSLPDISTTNPAVVMAGGVAANSFLRHM